MAGKERWTTDEVCEDLGISIELFELLLMMAAQEEGLTIDEWFEAHEGEYFDYLPEKMN